MANLFLSGFLAGVISDVKGSYQTAACAFRRYAATVRTSAQVGGNIDSRATRITYEVGRVSSTAAQALSGVPDGAVAIDASYPTSVVLSEEFAGLAKKYTNFAAAFTYSSLAGVAERLARALAVMTTVGGIDSDDIRSGAPLRVQAVNVFDGPVNSLVSSVFIPRLVNKTLGLDIFAVLVNAVAGEGSAVVTDVLELDATTRQPILGTVSGPSLARAIVEALRLVGANMIASDQGPLFALAVTRGLHRTLTVVGHTDEGAVVRDLLRCGHFGAPFGGIHYSLEPYAGIPALSSNGLKDIIAFVDSIALVTAGVVAHCDPGTTYGGRWFPTFFNGGSEVDGEQRPGAHLPAPHNAASRNRAQLLADLSKFSDRYVGALAKIFNASGDTGLASSIFCTVAHQLPQDCRHLRFASVTPFFWVEPTSLIPAQFLDSPAERGGAGAFVSPAATDSRPAWPGISRYCTGDVEYSSFVVDIPTPRAAWFFAHWHGNPLNGLSAVKVRQLDPNLIVHPGHCEADPEIRDRLEANHSIADYLWTRGQSPFCAPGELMNLGGTMGLLVHHYTFDQDGIPFGEHVPTATEFANTVVTISVGRPRGISSGAANSQDNNVRRARTRATRELAASAARVRLFGRADTAAMPIASSAPNHPSDRPLHQRERARDHDSGGGVDGWTRGAVGGPKLQDPDERGPDGVPVPAVPQQGPVHWPQLSRPVRAVGGGANVVLAPPEHDAGATEDDIPLAPDAGAAPPNGPEPAP
ncbi:MAG: coat protein [Hangzhou totivirus 5]|nr:MAG: coat protein [Hangzhou totivirus 5]